MPSKGRQFLQAPLQLSLFDFEQLALPTPTAPPPLDATGKPAQKRRVLAEPHIIEYWLRRSKRRSIGFLIEDDGLHVTAPRWVTIAEIEEAVRSKQRWIVAKLDERRKSLAQKKEPTPLGDGASIPFLGKIYTLRVQSGEKTSGVALDDTLDTITVSLRPNTREDKLKMHVENWLQKEARRVFSQRLPTFSEKLGVTYRSFALSSAMTQWGSCTAQGTLRLNWRLIHLSLDLIDYVIAHELSHLREMNHGPRFWSTVKSIFPEYENAKKLLRGHSPCALSAS
jgi:predicted metal-dependent hydrolase